MQIMNLLAILPTLTIVLVAACKIQDIRLRQW